MPFRFCHAGRVKGSASKPDPGILSLVTSKWAPTKELWKLLTVVLAILWLSYFTGYGLCEVIIDHLLSKYDLNAVNLFHEYRDQWHESIVLQRNNY